MSARAIELHVPIAMAPVAANESLVRVMDALAKPSAPPDRLMPHALPNRLTLAVQLADLHVGVVGEVSVPTEVHVVDRPVRWEFGLSMRAASNDGIFPSFEGTVSLSPVGRHAVELWLQGSYAPPFGAIGALLDRTVLRHAAERSLTSFLQRIADDMIADAKVHYDLRIL
jgi:hypothetical protein